MADLSEELLVLGGGGKLGTALQAARYWPATTCGLMVPGTLTGSPAAAAVLVGGAAGVGLTLFVEKRLRSESAVQAA